MKVHLIRSEEYSKESFKELVLFLHQSKGPCEFITPNETISWLDEELNEIKWTDDEILRKEAYPSVLDASDFLRIGEESKEVSWPGIFSKTKKVRKAKSINEKELVIIITDHANEHNWFSAGDPRGEKDFFVQSSFWELYVDGPPQYAVAYEVASIVLQSQLFRSYKNMADYAHKKPRGCMNDLCQDKPEISMKLRTADLCKVCMALIKKRKIDSALVSQVLQILDRVRSQFLFRDRYALTHKPSRIQIKGWRYQIHLPDLGNEELRLSPVQRAVYLLFLRHSEGISFKNLPDYFEELKEIYQHTYSGGSVAAINNTINHLVTNKNGSLSEVFSKIRSRIRTHLGNDLGEIYLIQGERGELRRILLDPILVCWENHPF
jgi:hypothetical protein